MHVTRDAHTHPLAMGRPAGVVGASKHRIEAVAGARSKRAGCQLERRRVMGSTPAAPRAIIDDLEYGLALVVMTAPRTIRAPSLLLLCRRLSLATLASLATEGGSASE